MPASRGTYTQSQKLMTFVLSMSLYGLATLISELIPSVQVGVVEFSVEFFLFIPLTIAMLFDPLSAALGAATGELVFSEIMLGQFGGIGELEKFLTVTIALYVAGSLVKDPRDMRRVALVSFGCTALQLAMSAGVDICKVVFAVEEFEAVPGLPESVFFTEGFAFVNDLLFSGILFCTLPTMFLVPRLYGKIEPLLGMRPRTAENAPDAPSARLAVAAVACFVVAVAVACLSEAGLSLVEWEAEWAESEGATLTGIVVAAVVAAVAAFWAHRSAQLKSA
ncbi:MAG TPA: cell division protein FtsQ [Olsenella sp.]|nr:cell division protein FtsQ [Olsenella sp.]